MQYAELPGEPAALVEKRTRDVAEDDAAFGSDALEGAERDQAFSGADIEERVARAEVGELEDAIANRFELLERSLPPGRVVTVTVAPEPLRPPVGRRHVSRAP